MRGSASFHIVVWDWGCSVAFLAVSGGTMAWNKRLAWTAFFSTLAGAAFAQDSSELAKELANPIASLISVPFQGNYDCCLGPSNADRWTFNVQPVVPLALNSDWNLIVRTIMPIVSIPTPSSTNASLESGSTVAENAAVNSIAAPTGLGDTLQSFFFSPQSPGPSGIVWGAGPAFLYPTATNTALGAQRWGAGPTVVVLKQQSGWTYGFLANYIQSFAQSDPAFVAGDPVKSTFVQPFLAYTTASGFTTMVNSESTYDLIAHQWTVPVNLLFSQVFKVGDQPFSIQVGPRYYVETPANGPRWGARFGLTVLFPAH